MPCCEAWDAILDCYQAGPANGVGTAFLSVNELVSLWWAVAKTCMDPGLPLSAEAERYLMQILCFAFVINVPVPRTTSESATRLHALHTEWPCEDA